MGNLKLLFFYVIPSLLLVFSQCTSSNQSIKLVKEIGVITAFSELVAADVKQLALSSPLTKEEADAISSDAEEIANSFGVDIYREKELIETDLFPKDVAKDREVYIIAKPRALRTYQTLKSDAAKLEQEDQDSRRMIARRFGRLLSYSPKKINNLLSQQTSFRDLSHFGIKASNVFLYYNDVEKAEQFYTKTLGLKTLSRFDNAIILQTGSSSTITLVDSKKGMHSSNEPKTVAIALLTNQLEDWYEHLLSQKVKIKYPLKLTQGGAHDGFVAVDAEGYLLEFETFKQHPENETFIPILDSAKEVKSNIQGKELSLIGSIVWTYHKDLLKMENFYQTTLGLELVADQGWTKIYQVSESGFIGLVDERRGMHSFTDEKAVTLSFILDDLDAWYYYSSSNQPFDLREDEVSTGPDGRYRAFVGFCPENYYLEFDQFYPNSQNDTLMNFLSKL